MSEVHFSCPHCQAKLHVSDQYVGRAVKCAKCNQTSTVPAPLAEPAQEDEVITAEDVSAVRQKEPFAVQLGRSFVYPFKGSGIFLLIGATVVLVGIALLSMVMIPIAGQLFMAIVGGYVCAFYISVIGSTAGGEDELPDWPDLSSMWDDVIRPVLLVAAAIVASFAPLIIYHRIITGHWLAYLDDEPMGYEKFAFVVWGLLYLPMSLLAIAMYDSVVALNPVTIIGAIAKIPLRYLLACLFFFLVYFANIFAGIFLMVIPILGMVVQIFFSLYMMMVAMRILGLIYYANSKKLGWFEDK